MVLLKWKGGVVEEDGGLGVLLSSLRAEEGNNELLGIPATFLPTPNVPTPMSEQPWLRWLQT